MLALLTGFALLMGSVEFEDVSCPETLGSSSSLRFAFPAGELGRALL